MISLKARGAFSATKVPTLPKVAPPKAKPLRRPSPNKAAILKPSNPLMQSIKTQAAKESILVPPRRVVKPKKTVTVVDPRAKQVRGCVQEVLGSISQRWS